MTEEKLNVLKKKRAVSRSSVTKTLNNLEGKLLLSEVAADEIEELLENLKIKFDKLQLIDKDLEFLFPPGDLDDEFKSIEEYEEKVTLCRFRANKKLNQLNGNISNDINRDEIRNVLIEENYVTTQREVVRVKLPKLNIPTFFGDVNQWLTFWNSFESAIHNNDSLNKVDKFNYLKAHLGGSALDTVEGFAITTSTYDSALELLKERFANTNLLIHTHMTNILNLKPLKNSYDVQDFRKLYDKIATELRSLECLGIIIKDVSCVLRPIILKALPQDILIEFNQLDGEKTGLDIKDLMKFLYKSLTAREVAIAMNPSFSELIRNSPVNRDSTSNPSNFNSDFNKYSTKVPSTLELLVINEEENKSNCLFCDSSNHLSGDCKYAFELSLDARKNILLKNRACFKCLRVNGHISRFCESDITCSYCSRKHSSLMCFSKYNQDTKDNILNNNIHKDRKSIKNVQHDYDSRKNDKDTTNLEGKENRRTKYMKLVKLKTSENKNNIDGEIDFSNIAGTEQLEECGSDENNTVSRYWDFVEKSVEKSNGAVDDPKEIDNTESEEIFYDRKSNFHKNSTSYTRTGYQD